MSNEAEMLALAELPEIVKQELASAIADRIEKMRNTRGYNRARGMGDAVLSMLDAQSLRAAVEPARGYAEGFAAARQDAIDAQPSTAENPNEDSYQRGRFDGVMEYGRAIVALYPSPAAEAVGAVAWVDPKTLDELTQIGGRVGFIRGSEDGTFSVPLYASPPVAKSPENAG